MLEIQAQISGPHDRKTSLPLKQTGPRRYEGRFPLWGKGRYQVAWRASAPDATSRHWADLSWLIRRSICGSAPIPITLREIAERTGGRILSGQETGKELFTIPREPKETSKSIVDWLLILLACLIPLDVGVRRVQLDWSVIRGWFGAGRKTESTETLGALLRLKEKVRETTGSWHQASRRCVSNRRRSPPARRPSPHRKSAVAKPAPEPESPASTTERLLAMKRKRQQERQNR